MGAVIRARPIGAAPALPQGGDQVLSRLTRNELATIRMAAGFKTAAAAATHLRISRIYLLELEQGRGSPSQSLLERMTRAFGIPEARLWKLIQRAKHDLHRRELARLKSA